MASSPRFAVPRNSPQSSLDDLHEDLRRAVARARRLPHKAWRVNDRLYVVRSQSQPGVWYDVRVTDAGLDCQCEAGRRGYPCKHAAKVWLRLLREYRPLRLSDLPPTPWDLFDGDEWESTIEEVAARREWRSFSMYVHLPRILPAA